MQDLSLLSGLQAIQTIKQSGLSLFMIGVVVTVVPLILSMFFARYILRYDNVAIMAGALSGARSANPAFGGVLDKAGNSIPTVPFAITYALANVFNLTRSNYCRISLKIVSSILRSLFTKEISHGECRLF